MSEHPRFCGEISKILTYFHRSRYEWVSGKYFFLFLHKTYVVGTH